MGDSGQEKRTNASQGACSTDEEMPVGAISISVSFCGAFGRWMSLRSLAHVRTQLAALHVQLVHQLPNARLHRLKQNRFASLLTGADLATTLFGTESPPLRSAPGSVRLST